LVASAQRPPVLQFSVSCLPQAFGLPYGAVVLAVVVMALGAFLGAEWSERKFAHLRPR
jgi:predicted Kef-type K+ transport protein